MTSQVNFSRLIISAAHRDVHWLSHKVFYRLDLNQAILFEGCVLKYQKKTGALLTSAMLTVFSFHSSEKNSVF